jgi:malate dehydrogenase (oxaloacetate-decarboxylating)(NADP+)
VFDIERTRPAAKWSTSSPRGAHARRHQSRGHQGECFYVEQKLRERLQIPVFHDDQHGTAIIVGAAVTNGLKVVGKPIEGQAGLLRRRPPPSLTWTCWCGSGQARERTVRQQGVICEGRETNMGRTKAAMRARPEARTLADMCRGADIFLGLSSGGAQGRGDQEDGGQAADPR